MRAKYRQLFGNFSAQRIPCRPHVILHDLFDFESFLDDVPLILDAGDVVDRAGPDLVNQRLRVPCEAVLGDLTIRLAEANRCARFVGLALVFGRESITDVGEESLAYVLADIHRNHLCDELWCYVYVICHDAVLLAVSRLHKLLLAHP